MLDISEELTKKDKFLKQLHGNAGSFGTPGIQLKRQEALSALKQLEFPTTRDEYWKYTRVGKIVNGSFTHKKDALTNVDALILDRENHINLVFVNGFYDEDLSDAGVDTDDLKVMPLSMASEKYAGLIDTYFGKHIHDKDEIFTALNTAYFTDGFFVYVGKNKQAEKTIHIVNIVTGNGRIAQPHNLVVAEQSSQVNIIHTFDTVEETDGFTNSVSEFFVAGNAAIHYEKLQYENDSTFHISNEQVYQEDSSRFHINTITLNGALVRNNLNIDVDAQNCLTNLYGLYLLKGKQHIDNHTYVDHLKAHCESNELYKGIVDEKGTAVFNGKVHVRKDSQKINAFQSNANILLTDDATINSKPELEIYADDVKCSHGSTVGQLDNEALFYLRSRGIGEQASIKLLMVAFAAEVLDELQNEKFAERVQEALKERFGIEG